jgi:2-phosphoglycolate phosphatase
VTAPFPSALLFDLDGTLIDSRRDIAAACNVARTAHGFEPLAFEAILPMIGDGARVLISRAFDATADAPIVDAALATFMAAYLAAPCVHTLLLPGVREILGEASTAKLPCAVVTNKPRAVTLAVLSALGLTPAFAAIWAGGDGILKPAPDSVRDTIARLGVDVRSAWMIGDGPQDIGAGRAAGCFTVGVPGIAERELLLASRPDLVCESLDDLRIVLGEVIAV